MDGTDRIKEAHKMERRVVIINKFGVRHPFATGRAMKDLADYLSAMEVGVTVVSIRATYNGQGVHENLELPYRIVELPEVYRGRHKLLRLAGNLLDGFRLIARSMFLPRHTLKIVMSDPGLISFWATWLRPFYRSRLALWTMDLYPDAFQAAGLVKTDNWAYRLVSHLLYRSLPDYLITLGEEQYHYLCQRYSRLWMPHTVLPCGVSWTLPGEGEIPSWRRDHPEKILFCYAGNVGEAHSAVFLTELINRLDPARHRMVLSLYGAKAEEVRQSIRNPEVVIEVAYVQLCYADISVASLLPAWNHVCVPSKVVSAICAGTAVVYHATADSEGARMFPEALWLVPAAGDPAEAIESLLESLTTESIHRKRRAALAYALALQKKEMQAYTDILQTILKRN